MWKKSLRSEFFREGQLRYSKHNFLFLPNVFLKGLCVKVKVLKAILPFLTGDNFGIGH